MIHEPWNSDHEPQMFQRNPCGMWNRTIQEKPSVPEPWWFAVIGGAVMGIVLAVMLWLVL